MLAPERVRRSRSRAPRAGTTTWRRELLAEWAADVVRARDGRAVGRRACAGWSARGSSAASACCVNVLARVSCCRRRPSRSSRRSTRSSRRPTRCATSWRTITAPTLVITGSQDTLTPLGDAEELAELIPAPGSSSCSGAAHGLMAEAPNAFNDAVLRFLDEIDRPNRDQLAAERANSGRPREHGSMRGMRCERGRLLDIATAVAPRASEDEPVDEVARRSQTSGRARRAGERLGGLRRVRARHRHRRVDTSSVATSATHALEPLGIELASEQVAQLARIRCTA